jgi:hypothetical protein
VVCHLIIEGYIKEDFHFTPYSTIRCLVLHYRWFRQSLAVLGIRIRRICYVFGPPGSAFGSVSHKYRAASGSFCHRDFLSLKNDVNVPVFRIRIRFRMFLALPDPHLDPLVRGADPRIRIWIHTKMSRIHNTRV